MTPSASELKKICVVTGTRAEFGLLRLLMLKIQQSPVCQLQIVVTGMHLSPEFGMTVQEIEKEFSVDKKIEILMSSDSPIGTGKSMGLALMAMPEAFVDLESDLVVILGDRYEAMAAAIAATLCRIPIAHIHGGEATEGAMDEAFRHSITKMSFLHFTSTEVYRQRVIQLGEAPHRVHRVGGLGIDALSQLKLLTKKELEEDLEMPLHTFFLVTFHPTTLEHDTATEQCQALLDALLNFPQHHLIFTKANSDQGGRVVNLMIEGFVKQHPTRSRLFASLGQLRYTSLMRLAQGVIGNSSSGLLEAPFFHTPTVDIGDRQKGRIAPQSVVHVEPSAESIKKGIETVVSDFFIKELSGMEQPYGTGGANDLILKAIETFDAQQSLKKTFFDLPPFGSRPEKFN